MTRRGPLLFLLGVGASVTGSPRAALASSDLGAEVQRLISARAAYGRVVQLKPRFLERGERLPLAIPPELLDPKEASCTTVTVLGVPTLHFVVRFTATDPSAPSSAFPESSAVGGLELTRCGASKPFLENALLELRSPRGLLETVISNAPAGVPPLAEVLATRDPGTELPLGEPGPRPSLAPLSQRLQRLQARAERDGALGFEREQYLARDDGSGGVVLSLKAGCHELTLLDAAPAVAGAPPIDLDLELVDEEGGPPLAIDRAEDADASGSVCLAAPSNVELRFAGASPNGRLLLTHARWDLPAGLPPSWGSEARAKLARLARDWHFAPQRAPVYESLGVQGTTELALEVEPDACYTVLLAPLRGEIQSLSLSAIARTPGERARGAADITGSAVSFCARGASVATLEVDARGASLSWILAAWQTGRSAPGLGEP